MHLTRILPLLLVFAGTARAADSPIDGTWEVTLMTKDGKADAAWNGATREHAGDKYTMSKAGGKSVSGTMKVTVAHKTIDLMPNEGQYKGKTLAGVYELTGDTLRIAFAEPGKDRPAKVEDREGITVTTYKRK